MVSRRFTITMHLDRGWLYPMEVAVSGEVSVSADGSEWVVVLDPRDLPALTLEEREWARDLLAQMAQRTRFCA